mgnify:CR=1 FL=1
MRCAICKQADMEAGTTTVTLERDNLTLVVKGVPAQVCPNCGESYVSDHVASRLLRVANEAVPAGTQVEIREFVTA